METAASILDKIHRLANPDLIQKRKNQFGIQAKRAVGLTQKQLNEIIKGVPKDENLALELNNSGIYEARLLCAKLFPPKQLNKDQANAFVRKFENWEICDTYALKLFCRSKFAHAFIYSWSRDEGEFVKRAAFATIAGVCMSDKSSENSVFSPFFELIELHAEDERLYVKKAISWALRSLGKRNIDLKSQAERCAKNLGNRESKSAQWISKDALKEFQNPQCRISDYPRKTYRA